MSGRIGEQIAIKPTTHIPEDATAGCDDSGTSNPLRVAAIYKSIHHHNIAKITEAIARWGGDPLLSIQ